MKNNRIILINAFADDAQGLLVRRKVIRLKVIGSLRCNSYERAIEIFSSRPDAKLAVYRDFDGRVIDVADDTYLPHVTPEQRNFDFNGLSL